MRIELPATFGAQKDSVWSEEFGDYIYIVKLTFGDNVVKTWEWQEDRPYEQRVEPYDEDVDEFVAKKFTELFNLHSSVQAFVTRIS